ncbi:MAG: sulfite exporter TauE/SafE family protein [Pseudomonadota bacterium]
MPLHLAYNAGRIASYTLAGAIAGALGGMVLYYDVLPLQPALYVLANLMLILLGLYLAGWSSLVTRLEAAGRRHLAAAMLAGSLLLGFALGMGRVAQGAHFVSHDLWSALICWLVVLALYELLLRRASLPKAD